MAVPQRRKLDRTISRKPPLSIANLWLDKEHQLFFFFFHFPIATAPAEEVRYLKN